MQAYHKGGLRCSPLHYPLLTSAAHPTCRFGKYYRLKTDSILRANGEQVSRYHL